MFLNENSTALMSMTSITLGIIFIFMARSRPTLTFASSRRVNDLHQHHSAMSWHLLARSSRKQVINWWQSDESQCLKEKKKDELGELDEQSELSTEALAHCSDKAKSVALLWSTSQTCQPALCGNMS